MKCSKFYSIVISITFGVFKPKLKNVCWKRKKNYRTDLATKLQIKFVCFWIFLKNLFKCWNIQKKKSVGNPTSFDFWERRNFIINSLCFDRNTCIVFSSALVKDQVLHSVCHLISNVLKTGQIFIKWQVICWKNKQHLRQNFILLWKSVIFFEN